MRGLRKDLQIIVNYLVLYFSYYLCLQCFGVHMACKKTSASKPPGMPLNASRRICRLPGRWSLHSTGTNHLLAPPVKRSTIGSRDFPIADPKTWNALPEDVTSSQVIHLSPPAQNAAFQEVSAGHHI